MNSAGSAVFVDGKHLSQVLLTICCAAASAGQRKRITASCKYEFFIIIHVFNGVL
jgi:hypothetical protein